MNQEEEASVCIAGVGLGVKEWFESSVILVGGRSLAFRLKCMCLKGWGGGGLLLPPGDRTCAFSGVGWGENKGDSVVGIW